MVRRCPVISGDSVTGSRWRWMPRRHHQSKYKYTCLQVQMMHQVPFCLIWGQSRIMQISGAHQWFHDIAHWRSRPPFADGLKKTVLTPCFKICCLWYIPSHFLSHFSFGQMTQIVRRHQQPALCGTPVTSLPLLMYFNFQYEHNK